MVTIRKRPLLTGLVAAALMLPAACSSGDPMSQAEDAVEARDYHAARVALASVLEAEPDNARALYLNAKTLIALREGVGAAFALERIPADSEFAAEKPVLMAEALLIQGKAEEALSAAQGAASPEGERVAVLSLLALGRDDEAKARLDTALGDYTDSARLLALRGAMALSERKISDAKAFAQRALEADPTSRDGMMLAGQLRVMRQDYAGARAIYLEAAETHPSDLDVLFALAAVEADLGKFEEADKLLANVLARAPGHPLAVLLGARLDFLKGDLDAARSKLQQNERRLVELPEGRLLLAEVAHLDGLHEQAIAHVKDFLRTNPGHAQARTVLAQSYDAIGETAKALDAIAPVARRASASPQAIALASRLSKATGGENPYASRVGFERDGAYVQALGRADRALADGDFETAGKVYDELLAGKGASDALVLNNAANVALKRGEKGRALQLARDAYALAPTDPQVKDTLGWAMLEGGGDKARALTLLKEANAAAPGNLQIRWHLANALAVNGQRGEAKRLITQIRDFAGPAQREEFDRLLARL